VSHIAIRYTTVGCSRACAEHAVVCAVPAEPEAGEADALQHLFGHEKQLRDRNSLLVSACAHWGCQLPLTLAQPQHTQPSSNNPAMTICRTVRTMACSTLVSHPFGAHSFGAPYFWQLAAGNASSQFHTMFQQRPMLLLPLLSSRYRCHVGVSWSAAVCARCQLHPSPADGRQGPGSTQAAGGSRGETRGTGSSQGCQGASWAAAAPTWTATPPAAEGERSLGPYALGTAGKAAMGLTTGPVCAATRCAVVLLVVLIVLDPVVRAGGHGVLFCPYHLSARARPFQTLVPSAPRCVGLADLSVIPAQESERTVASIPISTA